VGIHNFIANTKKTVKRNHGFTMVEIVIVVVVIGILAGITIVSYGSWRKNISEGQVKSDLSGVASAMEGARNFGSTYPTSLPTNFKPSSDVTLTYKSGDAKTYCIEGTTARDASIIFRYDISEKKEPQKGACTAHGASVANLMHNPNPTAGTYWKSSSTSIMTLSYVTTAGYNAVRSTRLTTANVALYGERNGVGVVTGSTGDQHTIMFTIVSPVTTTVTFLVGYGGVTSTTTLSGSNLIINLVANVPQTITRTVTVPSGITDQSLYFKILWGPGVGAVGDYFDLYRIMWVPGVYTGAYGDGYNTAAGWSWDGTANMSTSTGPTL